MAGAAAHGLAHAQHLVHDLVHGKGALQPSLASGAEAAGHRTAHLATHAHGEPLTAGNPHGFDAQTIDGAEQQLAGAIASVTAVQHPGAAQQGQAGFGLQWGNPLLSGGLWTPIRWWPTNLRLGPSGPGPGWEHRQLLQSLTPGLGKYRDGVEAAGSAVVQPVVQLAATEGGLSLGLGPGFQLGHPESQQGGQRHRLRTQIGGCHRGGFRVFT